MELGLATTEDIVRELKRRRQFFLFVGIGPTNRKEKQITYAYQGGTHSELVVLVDGLRQLIDESYPSNENGG